MTPIEFHFAGMPVLVRWSNPIYPMTYPPEECGFLPHGFLQPGGDRQKVCLYCQRFDHDPTFLCLPVCACHLQQALEDNQKLLGLLPRLDFQCACRQPKRGIKAPLNTDLGLLIRSFVIRLPLPYNAFLPETAVCTSHPIKNKR